MKRGEHFDQIVLGIPVGALRPICAELINDPRNPRFANMIENSHTVMTQAFQLWMNRPLHALRWPFHDNSIMTGYVEPLDTYANMSHLIPREDFPPEERVESIAYFCGVLEDHRGDTQARADARAREGAVEYLERDAKRIWPGSMDRHGFGWRYLVGGQQRGRAASTRSSGSRTSSPASAMCSRPQAASSTGWPATSPATRTCSWPGIG